MFYINYKIFDKYCFCYIIIQLNTNYCVGKYEKIWIFDTYIINVFKH